MKLVKRPVTEEKKNIAATHAIMDKVNLVGDMFQGAIRAFYARRIYKKLYDHKFGLLVAQRTIRNYKIGLANKIQFAQDHLDEVIKEREAAQAKHARITAEVDELKVSLAGGCNAKDDLLSKINKLEEIKAGLVKE